MKAFLKFLFVVGLILGGVKLLLFDITTVEDYSMVPGLSRGDLVVYNKRAGLGVGDVAVCTDPDTPNRNVVLRVLARGGSTIAFRRNQAVIDGSTIGHNTSRVVRYVDRSSSEDFEYQLRVAPEEHGGRTYEVGLFERGRGRVAKGGNVREKSVDEGLFLVGDNRNLSRDSRNFGEIDRATCLGQAYFVLWPGDDSGDLVADERYLQFIH